jgi:transmembrane sensor
MHRKEDKQTLENLISGYLNGEITPSERTELINLVRSSNENKRIFDEYSEIWITAKSLKKNTHYHFQEGFWKFKQKIKSGEDVKIGLNRNISFRTLLRYAAIIIVVFSLGGFITNFSLKITKSKNKHVFSEIIVPLGSHAYISLSDGSTVTLNAGSRLKYDNQFGIKDRIVQLEGEGYFKVAKDKDRPFEVKTSYLNVMALGTEFNVKAYSDDNIIETTLVEGSIKIVDIKDINGEDKLILKPNQKLTFFKYDSSFVDETPKSAEKADSSFQSEHLAKQIEVPRLVTETVDVKPVISWKEDKWIFDNQTLSQISVDLERKFNVKIILGSERLKTFRFSGIIISEPIEQVLEVLSISAPISFKLDGNVVTLTENKISLGKNKNLYKQD